jgi:hypothetical protein
MPHRMFFFHPLQQKRNDLCNRPQQEQSTEPAFFLQQSGPFDVASFRLSRVFYAWGGFRSAAVVEFLVRRRYTCRWFQAKQRDEGLLHCYDMIFWY